VKFPHNPIYFFKIYQQQSWRPVLASVFDFFFSLLYYNWVLKVKVSKKTTNLFLFSLLLSFLFAILGFELRAYTLSPFSV
jgi:hypothetical protein